MTLLAWPIACILLTDFIVVEINTCKLNDFDTFLNVNYNVGSNFDLD